MDDDRPRKTAKGEGYTTRVGGKKKLTTTVLQEQLEAAQATLRELQQQNMVLRVREAMQLETLESAEMALEYMASAAPQHSVQDLLPAVMLDMQALQLKQALAPPQPHPAAAMEAQSLLASAFSTLQAARAAVAAHGADSGSSSSSSDDSLAGSAGQAPGRRLQRLMATICPEKVQEARQLSVVGMAERIRDSILAMALTRSVGVQGPAGASASRVSDAVDNYLRTHMVSLVSSEPRHCQILGLNLETMQQEAPREQLWREVVVAAKLRPLQLQHIAMAVQTTTQQQEQLVQEQQGIMQQLQGLLGAAAPAEAANAAAVPPPATAGGAANTLSWGAPPAPLAAAGAAVRADSGPAGVVCSQPVAASAGATEVEAAAEAEAAAEPPPVRRARAAARKADAAAAAAAAAEAATGGGSPCQAAVDRQPQQQGGAEAEGGGGAPAAAPAAAGATAGLPAGVLSVEDAERAERLLQEWQRVCWAMKRQGRIMASMLINLLSAEQLADSTLAGYPYLVPSLKFCVCAVQMMQEKEKGGPIAA